MTYRHCTNLRVPLEAVDIALLEVMPDYRLGDPVPVTPGPKADYTPLTFEQLQERGFVGLYTTKEALRDERVMKKTGWGERPEKVLGRAWRGLE